MAIKDEYPNLDFLLGELFETAGDLKIALSDGDINVDEIVEAIPDDGVRDYVRTMLNALKGIRAEVSTVAEAGPWKMMGLAQELITKAMLIFK